jgi:hypothetical protein
MRRCLLGDNGLAHASITAVADEPRTDVHPVAYRETDGV